ncbi:MAG: pyridoxal-phosphate dependent enzyme [Betaproteobacteria bacterium]|nr:pyridoxal-phosphate dependent enzyme [Betaproteobacteria bacterium]
MLNHPPQHHDVLIAAERIRAHAHRTPITTCSALDKRLGASLFFKCENLQKVGAFKFRGACNAVFSLSDALCERGVIAHSSGNHAQALALAAKTRGIPAYIVMPSNAPEVKKAAVAEYGAQITFCEPTLQAREATQERIIAATGAVEIHPYDNYEVIAGQATAALELLEECPELDVVIAPVGGGGLLAGTAISAHAHNALIQVFGAEPRNADDAYRSLRAGQIIPSDNPRTVADGLLTSVGTRNFPILQEHLAGIVLASESSMIEYMKFFWERAKMVIEPSAATALAAIAENQELFVGKKIGVILSGGNADLNRLPWL